MALLEARNGALAAAGQSLQPLAKGSESNGETPALQKGTATTLQTGLNMLNELEGAGLLGMAYTFVLAGWVSAGCLLLCGAMAGYTGYCLAMCMYDVNGLRVRDTYASVGRACFGIVGERAVFVTQMMNLMSVCVVYLVLIGTTLDSVHQLIDDSDDDWKWLPMADRRLWTAIATVVVMPTVHIGGYRKISVLSAAGTAILVAIVVMGVSLSAAHISSHGAASMPEVKPANIPAAFSIFVFAFSAHGIFPALEASMAKPERFGCVVKAVFISNIIVKAVFGLVGFFAFGSDTNDVLTSNFSATPRLIISILIAANTMLSFPLPLVPVFKALRAAQDDSTSSTSHALQRTAVVLLCGAVAIAVPDFGIAMGFMGSLTLTFLTFVFPTVFFIRLHRSRLNVVSITCTYCVTCIGALGGIAGLYSNILLVVQGHAQQ